MHTGAPEVQALELLLLADQALRRVVARRLQLLDVAAAVLQRRQKHLLQC